LRINLTPSLHHKWHRSGRKERPPRQVIRRTLHLATPCPKLDLSSLSFQRHIRGLATSAHHLADALAGAVGRIPRLYADGFGDLEQLEQLVAWVRESSREREPGPVEVEWTGPPRRRGEMTVRSGTFESPVPHAFLPRETRRGHVQLLLPPFGDPERICLHLSSTGEAGFRMRTLFATPLLRRGIGALLLENPFYGLRRPAAQFRCSLRTVRDQFAMNYTTVVEARCLLSWLRREGHRHVGVTGYSQGGMMTAFAAALTVFPVAAIPRGAADAAGPVFLDGSLSKSINWPRLAGEQGGEAQARRFFRRCLEPVTVSCFPPPVDTGAAILVGARHDSFIPAHETEALCRHWAGSELRWLEGGHATSALYLEEQRRAVLDAFSRLESRHG